MLQPFICETWIEAVFGCKGEVGELVEYGQVRLTDTTTVSAC